MEGMKQEGGQVGYERGGERGGGWGRLDLHFTTYVAENCQVINDHKRRTNKNKQKKKCVNFPTRIILLFFPPKMKHGFSRKTPNSAGKDAEPDAREGSRELQ